MVGILQGKARGGEEESILMHDLKPFRILISLLDKPELGNLPRYVVKTVSCALNDVCLSHRRRTISPIYCNYTVYVC